MTTYTGVEPAQRDLVDAAVLRRKVLDAIGTAAVCGWASAIFDASTRQLSGCEVLARCRFDDGRLHTPDSFAWALDGSRDWIHLDLAMLEAAIGLVQATGRGAGGLPHVAWNTAPSSLSPAYVDVVLSLIDAAGVPASSLCLELTEHLPPPGDGTVTALLALQRAGVRLALDDFGSAHAPLRLMRQVAFDLVKLERPLIADLATAPGRLVVAHVVQLAHGFGAEVVAEGIETEQELDICLELGCDHLQGFLLGGEGLTVDRFANLVQQGELTARR